jgi:hypothetical protein
LEVSEKVEKGGPMCAIRRGAGIHPLVCFQRGDPGHEVIDSDFLKFQWKNGPLQEESLDFFLCNARETVQCPQEGAARDFGGECVPRFEISHRITYKCR